MKTCSKCKQLLPFDSFSTASGGSYLRPECRECAKKLEKRRKQLRSENKYPEENYFCPICLKSAQELKGVGGRAGVWVVDHDHRTEKFRGYICHNCNRALGNFQDDIERLRRAIDYLRGKTI